MTIKKKNKEEGIISQFLKILPTSLMAYIVFFCVGLWHYKGTVQQSLTNSLFLLCELWIFFTLIGSYQHLKSIGFRIRYTTKKWWLHILFVEAIAWGLLYIFVSDKLFEFAYLLPLCILPMLLIVDIIATIIKKIIG